MDPNLSPDGTKVAFFVPHGESLGLAYGDVRNEVWVKSLVDGSEVPVISDDYSRWTNPRLRGGFAGPVTSSGPSGRREIGSVSKRHFSLMGSITAPARLIASSGPEIDSKLLTDAVDAVLLTPV